MLCTMMPGAVSAIKQIRAAGIKSMILNGSGRWQLLAETPFPTCRTSTCRYRARSMATIPIRRSPMFNKKYKEVTGGDPSSQYVYPGYVLIEVWAKAVEARQDNGWRGSGGGARENEQRGHAVRATHLQQGPSTIRTRVAF